LKPVLDRFAKNPILPYNLACCACQLGNLKEAKTWLQKAFELDAFTCPVTVDEGYYVLLAPLPPGQHIIHFAAEQWGLDVTDTITVE
jgi:hypothetical protein